MLCRHIDRGPLRVIRGELAPSYLVVHNLFVVIVCEGHMISPAVGHHITLPDMGVEAEEPRRLLRIVRHRNRRRNDGSAAVVHLVELIIHLVNVVLIELDDRLEALRGIAAVIGMASRRIVERVVHLSAVDIAVEVDIQRPRSRICLFMHIVGIVVLDDLILLPLRMSLLIDDAVLDVRAVYIHENLVRVRPELILQSRILVRIVGELTDRAALDFIRHLDITRRRDRRRVVGRQHDIRLRHRKAVILVRDVSGYARNRSRDYLPVKEAGRALRAEHHGLALMRLGEAVRSHRVSVDALHGSSLRLDDELRNLQISGRIRDDLRAVGHLLLRCQAAALRARNHDVLLVDLQSGEGRLRRIRAGRRLPAV